MSFITARFSPPHRLSAWLSIGFTLLGLAAVGCGTTNPQGCAPGLALCNGTCVATVEDAYNCGACGTVCAAGTVCSNSACKAGCDAGLAQCAQSCVDVMSSPFNCGACSVACAAGELCSGSVCYCPAGSSCDVGVGTGGTGSGGIPGVGGSTIGTGGVAATGGVTGTGGDTATGGAGPGVPNGGYLTAGGWKGYVWTATSVSGATITPKHFGDLAQPPYCASGSVQPSANSGNVAMVGWNLNQLPTPEGGSPLPTNSILPTLDGILVSVSNPGGSTLRLQIQGPNGGTVATDRWCATIPGSGGFIAYSSFNTECWAGGKGTAYDKSKPIVAAIVLVPGGGAAASAINYDFCINNIVESDMDGPPPGTGCSLSGSAGEGTYNLTGSSRQLATRDGRQYVVQNNVWAGDSNNQAISSSGVSFEVTKQTNSVGTSGAPRSYPSVFIGSNFGAPATSGSNLPRQVSAIVASSTGVPTGWRWSGTPSGAYNATYDVWFSSGAGGDSGSPSGGYLMVWYHSQGEAGGNRPQPLGTDKGVVTVAGRQWNVWTCDSACQNGMKVTSYVPAGWSKINEFSFNLKDFIADAVTRNQLQSSWYLSNVFAGFEIWSGGRGLKTENFCAVVN